LTAGSTVAYQRRMSRALLVVLAVLYAVPALPATVLITDDQLDLGAWDVAEIETGDVTPVPGPDGIGRIEVTRAEPGSTGLPGDGFARTLIQGYDTSGSTGYGQIAAVVLWKTPIDPAAAGGFASISYAERAIRLEGGGAQATGVALKQGDNVYIRTIATTEENVWTPKRTGATPVLPADFSLLVGPGPSTPDLSAGGAPFQIGFFRANSGPAPSAGGTRVAGLDDLVIALYPPCTSAADCGDDGFACTVETCTAGVCAAPAVVCADDGDPCTSDACDPATGGCPHAVEPDGTPCADVDFCNGQETCQGGGCVAGTPPDCDDGNPCTTDLCNGECKNYLQPTFEEVEAQIQAFLQRIAGPACSGDPLVKKLRKKLRKAIARVRAQVRKADAKTRAAAIAALLAKAGGSLDAARQLLDAAIASGLVSPACGAELRQVVDQLDVCVAALPRHP
jgi:uncharacterized membrane protein